MVPIPSKSGPYMEVWSPKNDLLWRWLMRTILYISCLAGHCAPVQDATAYCMSPRQQPGGGSVSLFMFHVLVGSGLRFLFFFLSAALRVPRPCAP